MKPYIVMNLNAWRAICRMYGVNPDLHGIGINRVYPVQRILL